MIEVNFILYFLYPRKRNPNSYLTQVKTPVDLTELQKFNLCVQPVNNDLGLEERCCVRVQSVVSFGPPSLILFKKDANKFNINVTYNFAKV